MHVQQKDMLGDVKVLKQGKNVVMSALKLVHVTIVELPALILHMIAA